MANMNSTEIANLWANPSVANRAANDQGRIRIKQGSVEVTASTFAADGDTVRLCELPTNASVISIKLAVDDIDSGTNTAFNVGLYQRGTATAPGTLIDEDCYASALTYGQSAQALTEIMLEAAATNIDNIGQPVYLDADATATSDPATLYELVLTQTATVGGMSDGTYAYQVMYAVD